MKTKLLAIAAAAALAVGSITGCSTTTTSTPSAKSADPMAKRQAIDANVDGALSRLYAQDPSAREMVAKARGVLVFPSIVQAGFVVGGSYGQGALRMRGKNERYYSTAAGSVGLLAGAESKAVYILFMTQESLDKFLASDGWTVGSAVEDLAAAMLVWRVGGSVSDGVNWVPQVLQMNAGIKRPSALIMPRPARQSKP